MNDSSMAIQILPDVKDDKELCRIVDCVIDYIRGYNLKTIVSPFETTVEGDYDTLMEILKNCQLIACREGAPSLMSFVKIYYNPTGNALTIEDKIGKYSDRQ